MYEVTKDAHSIGLYISEPDLVFILSCLLGLGTALLHPGAGIRDFLLLVHSLVGLILGVLLFPVVLSIQWLNGERLTPIKLDPLGGILVLALLLCVSFWMDSCLQIESFHPFAMRISSTALLVNTVIRLSDRFRRGASSPLCYVDVGSSTDLLIIDRPELSIETTEMTMIDIPEIVSETPKRVESIVSPGAETTPSDFSQAHWFADSIASELDSEPEQWYYEDLRGCLQGPFSSEIMRRWYLAGFLMDDLLVSNKEAEPDTFVTIAHLKALDRHGNQIPF